MGQLQDVCSSGDASSHPTDEEFWSEMADLEESRGRVVAQASSLLGAEKEPTARPPLSRSAADGALGALADAFPAKLAEALGRQDDVVAKLRAEVAFLQVTEGLQLELEAIKRQAAAAAAGRFCKSARGVPTSAGLGCKGSAAKPAALVPVPIVGGAGTLGKRPRGAHLRRKISKGARPLQVMDTITEKEQPPRRELSPEAREAHRRSKLLSELRSVAKSLKASSVEPAPMLPSAKGRLAPLLPAPASAPAKRSVVSISAKASLVVDTSTEMVDPPSRSPSPASALHRPPRASPRRPAVASPSASPRTSPGPSSRSSPKASPRSSPRTSPRTSPQSSPIRGGAVPGPRVQGGFFLQHGSTTAAVPAESGSSASRGRGSLQSNSCTELAVPRRAPGALTSNGSSGARGGDDQSSLPRTASNQIEGSGKPPSASERLGSPRRASPTRAVPLVRPPWGSRLGDGTSSRGGTPRSRVPLVTPAGEDSGTPRRGGVVPPGAPDSARKTEIRPSQRRCTASSSPVRGSTPQPQEGQGVPPTIQLRQGHADPPAAPLLETLVPSADIGASYKLMQVPVEVLSMPPSLPSACEQHTLVRSIACAGSQTPPIGISIRSPAVPAVPNIQSSPVQHLRSPTPPAAPSFTPVQLPVRVPVVPPAASPPNPGRPPLPRSGSDFGSSGVSEFCIHTPTPPPVGFHNLPRCTSSTMAPVAPSLAVTTRTASMPSLIRLPISRVGRESGDVANIDSHRSAGVATPPIGGSRASSPHSTPPVAFQPEHLLVPRPASSASSSSLHRAQEESSSIIVETRSWLRPECAASLIASN